MLAPVAFVTDLSEDYFIRCGRGFAVVRKAQGRGLWPLTPPLLPPTPPTPTPAGLLWRSGACIAAGSLHSVLSTRGPLADRPACTPRRPVPQLAAPQRDRRDVPDD